MLPEVFRSKEEFRKYVKSLEQCLAGSRTDVFSVPLTEFFNAGFPIVSNSVLMTFINNVALLLLSLFPSLWFQIFCRPGKYIRKLQGVSFAQTSRIP